MFYKKKTVILVLIRRFLMVMILNINFRLCYYYKKSLVKKTHRKHYTTKTKILLIFINLYSLKRATYCNFN